MLLRTFMALCLIVTGLTAHANTQFRVIVDASGSMVISDPDRLTSESLRLIADLAPDEETSLGVWLFGEQPRVLLPEAPITKGLKASLKNNLGGYVTEDLQTDLESVLRLMLDTPSAVGIPADSEQHWILVTDGMVDISLDQKVNDLSRKNILTPILNELIAKGIHLHTVSMTGYTDAELLKNLSLKTDASYTEVAVPEDLLGTFNRIFTIANKTDEIPFEGNTFFIDESVDEFTLLVFHSLGKKPKVIAPKGDVLTLQNDQKVNVAHGKRYTLVTVEKPTLGTWQVENVNTEKSSIRIVTNLKIEASNLANVLFVNEPLYSNIGLFEDGELIKDPILLEVLTAKQSLIRHRGELSQIMDEKELTQTNYQFKNTIETLTQAGDYELSSFVDGQSFARKLSQFFTLTPAVNLTVEAADYGLVAFSVKPSNLRLNLYRSTVVLEIDYSDGSRFEEELPLIGAGFWQKMIPAKNSDFKAKARLKGMTQTGVNFSYETPVWSNQEAGSQTLRLLTDEVPGVVVKDFIAESRDGLNSSENQVEKSLEEKLKFEIDGQKLVQSVQKQIEVLTDTVNNGDEGSKSDIDDNKITISTNEVILYAALNTLAFAMIGFAIWWVRKRNKRKSSDYSEET